VEARISYQKRIFLTQFLLFFFAILLLAASPLFGIFHLDGGQGKRRTETEQHIAGLNEYLVNGNY